MNAACLFGLHQWTSCRCARCSKIRNLEHDWKGRCICDNCGTTRPAKDDRGWRTILTHRWNHAPLKCNDCGIEGSKELRKLVKAIEGLSVCQPPAGAKLKELAQVIQLAVYKVESDFPGGMAAFQLGHHGLQGMNGWFESVFHEQFVKLVLHPGYSEYSISIQKHGPDSFSVEKYEYSQSDDDGGRYRYL